MILVDTNVLVAAARTADTHHDAAARLLRETDDQFLVAPTMLAERYADLGLGGTDASLVALAERLGLTTLATFDRRHFTVVRPAHTPSCTLLPA